MPGALPPWVTVQGDNVLLDVVVSLRATRTRVVGEHDGRLKVQLSAPPVDGKANGALVQLLAKLLKVSKAQVEIVGGNSNKRKTVRVVGVAAPQAVLRLRP